MSKCNSTSNSLAQLPSILFSNKPLVTQTPGVRDSNLDLSQNLNRATMNPFHLVSI